MRVDTRVLEGSDSWLRAWKRLSFWNRYRLKREIGALRVQRDPARAALTVGLIRRTRNLNFTRDTTMTYEFRFGGWARGRWMVERMERCERDNLAVVEQAAAT